MIFPSHVWMWELDHKEDWEPKNWCFWTVVWEKTFRVPWIARRWSQWILKEITPEYSLEGLMMKLKLWHFGHLMWRADLSEKTLIVGKIEGKRRRRWQMTEDEMVGWHHRLSGHEFEQAPGDGKGQGSLVCCSPWGHKESDTMEWQRNKDYDLRIREDGAKCERICKVKIFWQR